MKELNCLWTIMMSDGWFTGSKQVLLQKCIPNLVASDWINRYKWAAVVNSAQGARHWYSAQVRSLSTQLPTDFKISFSINRILHTRGTDDRVGNAECCPPAVFQLSLSVFVSHLNLLVFICAGTLLILYTVAAGIYFASDSDETNIPPSLHLSLSGVS